MTPFEDLLKEKDSWVRIAPSAAVIGSVQKDSKPLFTPDMDTETVAKIFSEELMKAVRKEFEKMKIA